MENPEIKKNTQENQTDLQKQYEELIERFKKTTDGLGLEIDSGILEPIALLNGLGYYTTASCEGHIESGFPWAWIDFGSEIEKLEDDNPESIYWKTHKDAKQAADTAFEQKFNNSNSETIWSDKMDRFWMDTYSNSLKTQPEYDEYMRIEKMRMNSRNDLRKKIQELLLEFTHDYPEASATLDNSGLIRINFITNDILSREEEGFIKSEKEQIKQTSDTSLQKFEKFLRKKYFEK